MESLIQQQEEDVGGEYGDQIKKEKAKQETLERLSPRPEGFNVLQSAQTLVLEEGLIGQIEQFGYPREYIVKSLNHNELNYATTSYYLLL